MDSNPHTQADTHANPMRVSLEKKPDELATLSGLGLAFKIETLKDFSPVEDIGLAMRTSVEAGGETIHDNILTFRRGSITTKVLIMNVRPGSEPPSLQTLDNIVETLQAE